MMCCQSLFYVERKFLSLLYIIKKMYFDVHFFLHILFTFIILLLVIIIMIIIIEDELVPLLWLDHSANR